MKRGIRGLASLCISICGRQFSEGDGPRKVSRIGILARRTGGWISNRQGAFGNSSSEAIFKSLHQPHFLNWSIM